MPSAAGRDEGVCATGSAGVAEAKSARAVRCGVRGHHTSDRCARRNPARSRGGRTRVCGRQPGDGATGRRRAGLRPGARARGNRRGIARLHRTTRVRRSGLQGRAASHAGEGIVTGRRGHHAAEAQDPCTDDTHRRPEKPVRLHPGRIENASGISACNSRNGWRHSSSMSTASCGPPWPSWTP